MQLGDAWSHGGCLFCPYGGSPCPLAGTGWLLTRPPPVGRDLQAGCSVPAQPRDPQERRRGGLWGHRGSGGRGHGDLPALLLPLSTCCALTARQEGDGFRGSLRAGTQTRASGRPAGRGGAGCRQPCLKPKPRRRRRRPGSHGCHPHQPLALNTHLLVPFQGQGSPLTAVGRRSCPHHPRLARGRTPPAASTAGWRGPVPRGLRRGSPTSARRRRRSWCPRSASTTSCCLARGC